MVMGPGFFQNNRKVFAEKLPDNTAAFVFSGEEKKMCADTEYRFLPDRNYFYLTGLEKPDFMLVILKKDGVVKEHLFAPEHDDLKERWTGKRMDFSKIAEISGISEDNIRARENFADYVFNLASENSLRFGVDGSSVMTATREFADRTRKQGREPFDISSILTEMRLVKSSEEIASIEEAARITEESLAEMKKLIKPGVTEYELYAKLEYEMAKRSGMLFAFQTIVSCGTNTFYLHHGDPERDGDGVAKEGSIIQVDVGARVNGYCADISRVYFVGRPESDDDKRVKLHGLIRELRQKAFSFIAPGKTFADLNSQMYDIAGKWLAKQGLINDNFSKDDVTAYYWHNTSHFLGLDVHDVGSRDRAFATGNCLAVEPGVYIPEWGVGFRIEDDVVLTTDGCRLLSSGADDLEGIIAD
ncbi:MAG: aminopeptidase P family protein [Ruminococcaceae bacterium]|nr:aminopeptidase P family protein [Oscillospiraceae bacterium]